MPPSFLIPWIFQDFVFTKRLDRYFIIPSKSMCFWILKEINEVNQVHLILSVRIIYYVSHFPKYGYFSNVETFLSNFSLCNTVLVSSLLEEMSPRLKKFNILLKKLIYKIIMIFDGNAINYRKQHKIIVENVVCIILFPWHLKKCLLVNIGISLTRAIAGTMVKQQCLK